MLTLKPYRKLKPKKWKRWECWTLDEEEIQDVVEEIGGDWEMVEDDVDSIADMFINQFAYLVGGGYSWRDLLKDVVKDYAKENNINFYKDFLVKYKNEIEKFVKQSNSITWNDVRQAIDNWVIKNHIDIGDLNLDKIADEIGLP